MADEPIPDIGNLTPLEKADTPTMDRLAKSGEVGLAYMVPEGMSPGSDTANLSVAGYDPKIYYTGRSPLEALSIGVPLKDTDVAIRCNIVTLSEEEESYEEKRILDHSSGEISTEDAAVLLEAVKQGLKQEGYEFYVGTSYRHLLVWNQGKMVELTPPHDILTQKIGAYLPEDLVLRDMMKKSYDILQCHPLNIKRKELGYNPANSIWFWGAGTKPQLPSFEEKNQKKGVMISAVDLLKGIGIGSGMQVAQVAGANGGLHTNYAGKAEAALSALLEEGFDFAYIHVEAPDEMGHQGLVQEKIQSIEQIDRQIIKRMVEKLTEAKEDFRMLILPDHPTPVRVRTHTSTPVPYLLYDSRKTLGCVKNYSERTAEEQNITWKRGYELMDYLLEK